MLSGMLDDYEKCAPVLRRLRDNGGFPSRPLNDSHQITPQEILALDCQRDHIGSAVSSVSRYVYASITLVDIGPCTVLTTQSAQYLLVH